jgi:hypothetical protein
MDVRCILCSGPATGQVDETVRECDCLGCGHYTIGDEAFVEWKALPPQMRTVALVYIVDTIWKANAKKVVGVVTEKHIRVAAGLKD